MLQVKLVRGLVCVEELQKEWITAPTDRRRPMPTEPSIRTLPVIFCDGAAIPGSFPARGVRSPRHVVLDGDDVVWWTPLRSANFWRHPDTGKVIYYVQTWSGAGIWGAEILPAKRAAPPKKISKYGPYRESGSDDPIVLVRLADGRVGWWSYWPTSGFQWEALVEADESELDELGLIRDWPPPS
jgi:hypothetical protein